LEVTAVVLAVAAVAAVVQLQMAQLVVVQLEAQVGQVLLQR
jgi:hypothetical protein